MKISYKCEILRAFCIFSKIRGKTKFKLYFHFYSNLFIVMNIHLFNILNICKQIDFSDLFTSLNTDVAHSRSQIFWQFFYTFYRAFSSPSTYCMLYQQQCYSRQFQIFWQNTFLLKSYYNISTSSKNNHA